MGRGTTDLVPSSPIFRNKEKVLVSCSRGCTARYRHLMTDLRTLLPHHKRDVKLDSKDHLPILNEICEMKSCNNALFFEVRKRQDLYLWLSKAPNGPSAKFLCVNVHTMDELKMLGNALKGSRPLLIFDRAFDDQPHLRLLKEMFTHSFTTPNRHAKSKPFFDHAFSFSFLDGRIWFRHYQIIWDGETVRGEIELNEIGPRFVLQPIRIFSGSFHGETIYRNEKYVSPNTIRSENKAEQGRAFDLKKEIQQKFSEAKKEAILEEDPIDNVFKASPRKQNKKGKKRN